MDGVTILEVFPKVTNTRFLIDIFFVCIFLALLIGLVYVSLKDKEWQSIPLGILAALMLFGMANAVAQDTFTVQYKIKLDSSVSYNEFLESYEVISEDDGILTVERKPCD